MRRIRRSALGASLLSLAVFAAACGGGSSGGGGGKVTVGADNFAESEIVAEMFAQVLEANGWQVSRKFGTTRETRIPAMQKGEIDVAPDYLATLLSFLDPNAKPSSDPGEVASALKDPLSNKGLEVLDPSAAVDTNGFVVTKETAQKFSLSKLSDLASVASQLTLGGPPECPTRPFCALGLKDTYGITFGNFKPLDAGGPLTVEALKGGEIDVGLLFSTDAQIASNGWVLLEDDKHLQAADNITPLVKSSVLNDKMKELLNKISSKLTTQNMTDLNSKVVIDKDDPAAVAKQFLQDNGLL
jgi:osmoprotectant transport system substrate-binding protein